VNAAADEEQRGDAVGQATGLDVEGQQQYRLGRGYAAQLAEAWSRSRPRLPAAGRDRPGDCGLEDFGKMK
jgi:hypothetical protein